MESMTGQAVTEEIQEDTVKTEQLASELFSVVEMGKLLGLKKTERYWLVHKNLFVTKFIFGRIWVVRESFEKWYSNQVKYHKVNGEEPGMELKQSSYSARDIAGMLQINEGTAYEIIKHEQLETIKVDGWKRVPKEAFEEWYRSQNRYRTAQDRERDADLEKNSLSMPEMARLLGITRHQVYSVLKNPYYSAFFETIIIAGKKRITWESFNAFLDGQDKYYLKSELFSRTDAQEKNHKLSNFRVRKILNGNKTREIGTAEYLTMEEACLLANASKVTVTKWIREGQVLTVQIGSACWIARKEFEDLLDMKRQAKRR